MTDEVKPRYYSYVRFSSVQQEEGDSERRQIQAAKKWAEEKGGVLDDELLVDRGKSAYHSAHVTMKGALGQFISRIKKGDVPKGSTLIIESFDRLGRENVDTARERLREIVRSGVKVVTLNDKQEFDENSLNDPAKLIISIIQHSRSHEESLHKAERLREAWNEKRSSLENKKLYTKQVPAWLHVDDDGRIEKIPERVKLIEQMFQLYTSGYGFNAIARQLNGKDIEVWNSRVKDKNWNISAVKHLLSHRALLGEFQPHEVEHVDVPDDNEPDFVRKRRIRKPTGGPIKNYFPPVIEPDLFDEAQRIRASRRKGAGGRTGVVSNLFTRLGVCGYCGARFAYEKKGGKSSAAYFNCIHARLKKGDCAYASVRYDKFEDAFLKFITELDVSRILFSDQPKKELEEERRRLNVVQTMLDDNVKSQKNISRAIEKLGDDDSVDGFIDRQKELSFEKKKYENEVEKINARIWALEAPERDAEDHLKLVKELRNRLRFADDKEKLGTRHALRNSIQRLVDYIEFFPRGSEEKQIVWDGKDIVVKPYVPEAEWGDLYYAESEGAADDIKKAKSAITTALYMHKQRNSGKKACKIIVALKGGYKHVFAWDADGREFVQDIATTREHPLMFDGKSLFINDEESSGLEGIDWGENVGFKKYTE